jgi:hypothetical protein
MIRMWDRYRSIGRGWFHCQRCGGDRPYQLRAGTRWLRVLLIPVVPVRTLEKHVRCIRCHTCYRPQVLALPTVGQMQAALPAAMRAAVLVMLRAGDEDSTVARARAVAEVTGAGSDGYDDADLSADLASDLDYRRDVARPLQVLGAQLAGPAAEWFLARVVRVGLCGTLLSDAERGAAHEIAAHLGLTAAQARNVISITEESAAAG